MLQPAVTFKDYGKYKAWRSETITTSRLTTSLRK